MKNLKQFLHPDLAFASRYYADKDGRIFRDITKPHRIKKEFKEIPGPLIRLSGDGIVKSVTASFVVCTAWHGPPPSPDHVVLHLDGNSRNLWIKNLRWDTRQAVVHHRMNTPEKRKSFAEAVRRGKRKSK
jgi:hypothetical protein